MRRTVLMATILPAMLIVVATGCSGENTPDVQDATGDVAAETISPDANDAQQPGDVHDVVDTGSDVAPRDTFDATDHGVVEVTDEGGDQIEPPDTTDVTDTSVQTDVPDVTDLPDTIQHECLTDEDCAGKVLVTVCQTPYCNEDNICEAINLDDDFDCTDNSICTTGDKCLDGQCVGTTVNCNDNLECTQDLCSEANYCYHRPYYGPCNDSNGCTENDSCATGTCVGTEIICNDNNTCTTDTCNIATGCVATKLSGIKCSDGDECTKSDTCANGVCVGTFDCDDDNPCTSDGCNELGCTHDPMTGDVCDDGLICTDNDACLSGTCTGSTVVCNDDDVCTDDYCLEGTGCKTRFNTATCNDGNSCTRQDRCQYGLCKGTTYSCPLLTCMDTNNCDGAGGCVPDYSDYGAPCTTDNKQCTDDICSSGSCIHPNSIAGTSCNDGDMCTQTDECSNGACVGKDPVACSVVDACKDPGTCDPSTGTCTLGVLPEGSSCNDGQLCTKNDRCSAGACSGTPVVCIAISDCHEVGTCDPANGTCNEVFKDDGAGCNDRNSCTLNDQCLDGTCVGGNPVICTALDDCHVAGSCNISNGLCSNPVAVNNTICDDGVLCTQGDKCTNGSCAGAYYSCNDNLSCTTETCDGDGGCVYDVLSDWCRIDGACRLVTSVKPGEWCMVCDPAMDQEDWTPVTGGFCDDMDSCTFDDTCTDGTCAGTLHSCDDGILCTVDSCDGLGGCVEPRDIMPGYCLIDGECYFNNQQDPDFPCQICDTTVSQTQFTSRDEGDTCDDGVACTHSDKCTGNVCGGIGYACDDSIDCTTDSCKGDGTCLFAAIPGYCFIDDACVLADTVQPGNACAACIPAISSQFWSGFREGEACDDGSLCTDSDKCSSGVCQGAQKCDDAMDCTDDVCNQDTGECTNTVQANYCTINGGCHFYGDQNGLNQCMRCIPATNNRGWTATTGYGCDDSDACTLNDTCDGTVCTGTQMSCDDGLECTTDFCEYGRCGTVPNEGWCIIANQCIASGYSPVDEPCLICDPSTNPYDWSYTYLAACDDVDSCTYGDVCIAGMCTGQAYDCSDGVYCTNDVCDGSGGCSYSVVANMCLVDGGCFDAGDVSLANGCEHCAPLTSQLEWAANDGVACDDGNNCSSNDLCLDRGCAGTSYDCDDDLVCTADSCNGDGTCDNLLTAGWCFIDGLCYRDQTLEPGNICSACLSSTANDTWSPNNGLPCDDNLACTKVDTCSNSECVGTAYVCDDAKTCTSDACDGQGGCVSTLIAGNCMIDYKCYADNQINPDNICEKCTAGVSFASWSKNDDYTCNDFDSCTINDVCANRVCAGTTYSCDDEIECTLDLCDGSGGCTVPHPLAPDACRIDGICYAAGDKRPGFACEACDPGTSQDSWTELNPEAIEICNGGVDEKCDGVVDPEGAPGCVNYYIDHDIDGVGVASDVKCLCEPNELYRTTIAGDCDDNEPQVYAGHPESCDGLDNDCDGTTDPDNTFGCQVFFSDNDGDTWGNEQLSRCLCSASGTYTSVNAGDCNDNAIAENPAAAEVCNGIDDNCDGRTDPQSSPGCTTYYLDTDHDTWGDATVLRCLCATTSEFSITRSGDCNDFNATINPDRTDICNNIDDDCSGLPDDEPLLTLCPHDPASVDHGTIYCDGACLIQCVAEDINTGEPAWYNRDNIFTNGCECQGDLMELTSTVSDADPYPIGPVSDTGEVVIATGKLTSAPNEDWLQVSALDTMWDSDPDTCDNFNLTIQFATNPNSEFVMDVYKRYYSGGSYYQELLCPDIEKWDFATNFDDGSLGECPCDNHVCGTWPADSLELAECKKVNGSQWELYCGLCGEHDPSMNVCTNNSQSVFVKIHRRDGATATCSAYQLEISNGYYEFVNP